MPCSGAAFIIAAGRSGPSFVGTFLAFGPINFVGRISYSLYLWHWPIIFFQVTHPFLPGAQTLGDRLAVILYSLGAATISWACIEQPFRIDFTFLPPRKIFLASAAALACMVTACWFISLNGGFPNRFTKLALHYASYLDSGQAHFRQGKCFITTPYTFADFDTAECLTARPAQKNDLLVGDSHAAQLWYGLSAAMPGVHVMQATASACLPAADPPASDGVSCAEIMRLVFQTYLPTHHVDRLLIAARWTIDDISSLKRTLAQAAALHIQVTLFGPMIEYDQKLPRLLAWAAETNAMDTVTRHQVREAALDDTLRGIALQFEADYVSIYTLLCEPVACPIFDPDGAVLQFDTDHLTKEGSLFLARRAAAAGLLQ